MENKIESGIPIPPRWSAGAEERRVILANIKVGDSVAYKNKNDYITLVNLLNRHGIKTTARTMADGTYRVWRVE